MILRRPHLSLLLEVAGDHVSMEEFVDALEEVLSPFDLKSILLACEELIQKRSATGQTEGSTAQAISQI